MNGVKDITFNSQGYMLHGRVSDLPKTKSGVILLHGLTNSIEEPNLMRTEKEIWEKGIKTLVFDFYGSGKSPGTMHDKTFSIMLDNIRDAMRFFREEYNVSTLGLWGRSVGGSLAIIAYEEHIVKSTVLLSTPIFLVRDFSHFKDLAAKQAEMEKMGKNLPGTGKYKGSFSLNMKYFEELPDMENRIMNKLQQMQNVLIFATDPDQKVPLDNALTLSKVLGNRCSLKIFYKTDHAYTGVEDEVTRITADWFAKTLLNKEGPN